MKIVFQSHVIETKIDGEEILRHIEKCGRTCYKSEDKIGDFEKTKEFIKRIINSGHESVIEHFDITIRFITDRGVTHELVRHRLASFSQESSRYCCYSDDKFGNEISVIEPFDFPKKWDDLNYDQKFIQRIWMSACDKAEKAYLELIKEGCSPQIARSVLPTCLKTEIVVTTNLREWRHILKLRTSKAAHPQMRSLMIPLLNELKERIPIIFDDILTGEKS